MNSLLLKTSSGKLHRCRHIERARTSLSARKLLCEIAWCCGFLVCVTQECCSLWVLLMSKAVVKLSQTIVGQRRFLTLHHELSTLLTTSHLDTSISASACSRWEDTSLQMQQQGEVHQILIDAKEISAGLITAEPESWRRTPVLSCILNTEDYSEIKSWIEWEGQTLMVSLEIPL